MPNIVNAALYAKTKAEVWTFDDYTTPKTQDTKIVDDGAR